MADCFWCGFVGSCTTWARMPWAHHSRLHRRADGMQQRLASHGMCARPSGKMRQRSKVMCCSDVLHREWRWRVRREKSPARWQAADCRGGQEVPGRGGIVQGRTATDDRHATTPLRGARRAVGAIYMKVGAGCGLSGGCFGSLPLAETLSTKVIALGAPADLNFWINRRETFVACAQAAMVFYSLRSRGRANAARFGRWAGWVPLRPARTAGCSTARRGLSGCRSGPRRPWCRTRAAHGAPARPGCGCRRWCGSAAASRTRARCWPDR